MWFAFVSAILAAREWYLRAVATWLVGRNEVRILWHGGVFTHHPRGGTPCGLPVRTYRGRLVDAVTLTPHSCMPAEVDVPKEERRRCV